MESGLLLRIIIAVAFIIISIVVFYNTIITRKWRNKAPDESKSWYYRVFYYNPADKRIWVPKRTGLGWTLNLAHNVSIVIIVFILALTIYLALAQ